ncbi:protein of unknown function UPF0102 [Methylocella silvestris BL2]|uniref:UPF0102 protein Msil_0293 n=1 Tax=Methylocella silvestris (strain DSM 15510 / CIP 108128 / LMG 27833 / NCIMB 13906 / BL2) TaxID=395965 RepID=Y293_METSB|nr:YraN family protein [Methylocella silvestris]B8EP34.1 RecName: Full=UPF0102 protein Msil_0293 [Methylocella silvestris BL2]ACK49272.1 protein of unknown function UPF0102 [Methylocella silvestris BL2]
MRDADDRRAALWQGRMAERAAILALRLKRYAILERGYRIHGGEIDIIARRGDTIAFVEVKARPTMDGALQSITPQKRRRICRAARVWLASHPYAAAMTLRGDAVFVAPWRWPHHVAAAVELDFG